MEELSLLRNQINDIDDELVGLFLKRMDRVKEVGLYKQINSIEVVDKGREEQIVNKHIEEIEDSTKKIQLKDFMESLISISRKAQFELLEDCEINEERAFKDLGTADKVGFQGIVGSFSNEALLEVFGEEVATIGYKSFKEVFEALKKGEIKYGVLPIENSSTGGISEVYDLLNVYNAFIVGEKCIEIEHNLLGILGTKLSMIKEVYSHSQGFLQCSQFFDEFPDMKLIPYYNTAKSAEYVSKENCKSKACVASKKAANIYGLNILKESVNNNRINNTRFIIIAKGMEPSEQNDKISMVMILPHRSGALYSILKYFAANDINMSKIESRPIANKAWRYYFYIDITGNLSDENTIKALKCVEKETLYFKLLGNYKSEI